MSIHNRDTPKMFISVAALLEINANPLRLDLDDIHARMTQDIGLIHVINTDARHSKNLAFMNCGIHRARRGPEREDVLNARPWSELNELLKR